ncbi:MAG: Zn-dependent oligopeptidase [Thermoplasmata archaeon]|nr:Zn-dependent oligopeptidase [Thermoplasmata archaeon]
MPETPTAATPWPPTLGELTFRLTGSELRERATALIEGAQRDLNDLVRSSNAPTVASFLAPLDRLLTRVSDVSAHGGLIFSVHTDAETRTTGREISEAADRFLNEYRLNEGAYHALQKIDLSGEDDSTRFAVAKMLRDMRRAGADRDPPTRARLLEMSNSIDRVSNQFSENIAKLDREVVLDDRRALQGLPPDFIAAHSSDSSGKIRLNTKYPDVLPVMAYCDDAEVRRRLLEAFMNRAYPENLPVLDELLAVRGAFARSLGYASYAAYALEDKMMETPANARNFLGRVAGPLQTPAAGDLERYLERKRRDLPGATRLEFWDSELSTLGGGYYDGKIRTEEFGVDTRVLRKYLPYVLVRDGLLRLCGTLFGITFQRNPTAEVWHPTVEAYDVFRGPKPLGRCYLDLIPRDGKFSHAACFAVREGLAGLQFPQSALLCNFLDPTVDPAVVLMEWKDVITFFHEFGHLLHALLSGQPRWSYNSYGHLEWDFIEAPSQLFEEWARDPATLAQFARDPETGDGIPAAALQRLQAAEAMGRASRLLRQVGLATASLELYDRDPAGMETTEAFRAAWDRYNPRPIPREYHLQAAFGHLTGYSAFYYTYLWSVVIARDLLSPFHERGTLTDPATAERYATEILAPGGSRPAAELIRTYLGRDFRFDAFERWTRESLLEPAARSPSSTT